MLRAPKIIIFCQNPVSKKSAKIDAKQGFSKVVTYFRLACLNSFIIFVDLIPKLVNQPIKRKKKFSYLSSILSISMVLLMLGLFGFLVIGSRHMETYLKENMVINVFLQPTISDVEVKEIQQKIEGQDFLKSLNYVSKEQAATDFSNELGQDFVSFLGYNPLMGSFQVKVKESFNNPESLAQVETYLRGLGKITEVSYQRAAYDLAQKNIRTIGLILFALASIFGVIAVLLIHNTVRLNLYAQRFIIKSMQLVGATHWFITKPFVWQSIKNGLWGWLIALLLLVGLNQTLPIWIPEWAEFEHGVNLMEMYAALLILGMIISFSSSFISTRKYLYSRLEDLY
ncbi:MAG: cell division protein FtsX [Bacteroidetes bacterium B1(2017)]|nr:MAG: cell division protein FtsX [Bacteroidetes bacterium B1(2017)]